MNQPAARTANLPVLFEIDTSQEGTPLRRSWEVAVGCGDAWSILRADLQDQLRAAAGACGFRYLRCHGILSDQLQVVRRGSDEALVYNWQLVDAVYDVLLDCELRPFVELGFMPAALASGVQTAFHYRANVTPPADYSEWTALIRALVGHWRDRYGVDELRRWYFEVWSEPNRSDLWSGTREAYFRLYAATALAVKAIDPALRVGGPATARGEWLSEFVAFCRTEAVPLDFVSTHVCQDDDTPDAIDREPADGSASGSHMERTVQRTMTAMAGERTLDGAPLEVHWTEWNPSRRSGNAVHDSTNQAAYLCRVVHAVHGRADSFAYWAVSDIFNEGPYPTSELHGGYGMQTLHGLPKPVFHAYALLHRLGDRALDAHRSGEDDAPESGLIDCWAAAASGGVQVLLSHYTPPGEPPAAPRSVTVRLAGLPPDGPATLAVYRLDAAHASVLDAWEAYGRPDNPTLEQLEVLREVSSLLRLPAAEAMEHAHITARGAIALTLDLPAGGAAFVEIVTQ